MKSLRNTGSEQAARAETRSSALPPRWGCAAWSSRDTDRYLGFYGSDFSTQGMDRKAFAAHKRRVNASKKFIDVQLRDLSLFRYPGTEEPLWLAEFTMDYKSDNYSVSGRKQQFWKRTPEGAWQIFREENR